MLGIYISEEKNVCSREFRSLVDRYGKHIVYTDGGTWYPQVCNFLHLKQRLYSSLEKSLIERVMQHFKDRTESFDDYYSYTKNKNCGLANLYNWVKLFIYLYK